MRWALMGGLCGALLALATATTAETPLRFVSVGSGELDGGYYRAAGALCDAVNAAERGRLYCSVEATQGSRYNIDGLLNGELEFGLAQADLAFSAFHGTSIYADAPPRVALRTVAPLYVETVTILARPESGIVTQRDLIGRRVDIGPPASGRNATARALLAALDTDLSAFAETSRMSSQVAVAALCDGRVDAVILVVGHPSTLVAEAMAACGAAPVAMMGPQLDAVIAAAPFYSRGVVRAAAYPGLEVDVPTIDVAALLLTSVATPEDSVAAVAAAVLGARQRLAETAPLLAAFGDNGAEPAGAPPLHHGAAEALAALDR
jgi:TRAP transporter TAXI family solute receptor